MAPPLRSEVEKEISPIRQTEAALAIARKAVKRFASSALVQNDAVLMKEIEELRKRLKKACRSAETALQRCIDLGQA